MANGRQGNDEHDGDDRNDRNNACHENPASFERAAPHYSIFDPMIESAGHAHRLAGRAANDPLAEGETGIARFDQPAVEEGKVLAKKYLGA